MTTLGERLIADHERLEELFEELLANVHCGDCAVMTETWATFEHALLGHLGFEERLLLPDFAVGHPTAARAIVAEHAMIREEIDLLWVELQLHVLREARVQAFVELLREHAARETTTLYPWASERHAGQDRQWHPTSAGPSIA